MFEETDLESRQNEFLWSLDRLRFEMALLSKLSSTFCYLYYYNIITIMLLLVSTDTLPLFNS